MADFAVNPAAMDTGAGQFAGLGDELGGLDVAVTAALTSMEGAAGDGELAGALGAAAGSAQASLLDVAKHVTAFAPALATTARNYERSDVCSATGLRAR